MSALLLSAAKLINVETIISPLLVRFKKAPDNFVYLVLYG